MMHSAMEDIQAMHSRDPDRFGTIASKYDDSFGNALWNAPFKSCK